METFTISPDCKEILIVNTFDISRNLLFTVISPWFLSFVIRSTVQPGLTFICLCNVYFQKLMQRHTFTVEIDPFSRLMGYRLIPIGIQGRRITLCIQRNSNLSLATSCTAVIAHSFKGYLSYDATTVLGIPSSFGKTYFTKTYAYYIVADLFNCELPRSRLHLGRDMSYAIRSCRYYENVNEIATEISGQGVICSLHADSYYNTHQRIVVRLPTP